MKIGILTFHWATNYGAVMQCFALQHYLEREGYEVEIINYKPERYDYTLCNFVKSRGFLHPFAYVESMRKEAAIKEFRSAYLHQSKRYVTMAQVADAVADYDAVIAGSDQILNPYFLMHGEGRRTPIYFLGFQFEGRKIAYAVSFGCTEYPKDAFPYAKSLIGGFDHISVRENTGRRIVSEMGVKGVPVVPDPTALMDSEFYLHLANKDEDCREDDKGYTYLFFIRNVDERLPQLQRVVEGRLRSNNDDGNFTMEHWLENIKRAKGVVTDSFHGMMMSLKLEVPFVVVTECVGNVGMNDRFYTLLGDLGLSDRVIDKDNITLVPSLLAKEIDWSRVRERLEEYKQLGVDFLKNSLIGR